MKMLPVLLHTCCAPCASSCIERLTEKGHQVSLFFSNSNIHPESEYTRRLDEARKLSDIYHLPLIEDRYDHEAWLEAVKGLEHEPEKGKRCTRCFAFSLKKSAETARSHGFQAFTTSLSVSPHKNTDVIFAEGSVYREFLTENFRKKNGFSRSLELSRSHDLYRQSYCGCEFSRG